MSILKILGIGGNDDSQPRNRLAVEIRERLDELTPERANFVACFAGLLVRVARADQQISDAERAALRRLIAEQAGLSGDESAKVAEIVTHHALDLAGIEYAQLTRSFNEIASDEEKLRLIDCLYAIATAESPVSVVEEEEIRAVANALLLSHSQFIGVRLRYRDQLEVMQSLRRR